MTKTITWTAHFTTLEKVRGMQQLQIYLQNVDEQIDLMSILFKGADCFMLVKLHPEYSSPIELSREIALGESDLIATMFSWKYNVPLKYLKLTRGNAKRIKMPASLAALDCHGSHAPIFSGNINAKNLDILSAYRQAKNEKNGALQYIMYYRLLERLAKDHFKGKKYVDKLLQVYAVPFKTIGGRSSFRYFRNKIHSTSLGYMFPYKLFWRNLHPLEMALRKILNEVLTKEG